MSQCQQQEPAVLPLSDDGPIVVLIALSHTTLGAETPLLGNRCSFSLDTASFSAVQLTQLC